MPGAGGQVGWFPGGGGNEVLIATDGGAYLAGEHYRWRAASWAVAVGEETVSGDG